MVAADYSPTSPKMTTTTTQTIKNEKVQSSLQPINQPNNTEIQQKLKPQAQIKPIKKPILKPVKEEITKQPPPPLQPHKTTIHQAKITKKSPKKVRHVKPQNHIYNPKNDNNKIGKIHLKLLNHR
jgi:hypothetical protein